MTVDTLEGLRGADEVVEDHVDAARGARSTTVRALQQLVEVLDGRRATAHLNRWVAADVIEEIGAGLRPPDGGTEAGRLVRVHLQMHGCDCADYFGTLTRGSRIRAVAGRVVRAATTTGGSQPGDRFGRRWMIVELTIV